MVKKIFELDLRSLAFTRILLGFLCLYDLGRRVPDIHDFFTDSGILPRWEVLENFQYSSWGMSLLFLNGSYYWALFLILLGFVASFFFIVGWHTRVANGILWSIIISFQLRFPEAATSGGDMLLRIYLLYSFFIPMNAYYSFDQLRGKVKISDQSYVSVFSILWIVQIILLYVMTFFYKWSPVYHTTFEAVWYMLQLDHFTTDFGKWLGTQYEVTKSLSFLAYALEIVGPILLLTPWRRDFFRALVVISFWAFHLGIGATLHLGNFVPICLIIWAGLVPSSWWNILERKLSFLKDSRQHVNERSELNRFEFSLGVLLLILVPAWNIEGYVKNRDWYIGSPFDELMFTLGLNQGWAMFAPHPQRVSGWWIMEGTLKDGRRWDALNNKEVSFERPRNLYETYSSDDWRKFLDNLSGTRNTRYFNLLGRHLCRKWNLHHLDQDLLMNFKLYFMQEWTNPPSSPPSDVKKLALWDHRCF